MILSRGIFLVSIGRCHDLPASASATVVPDPIGLPDTTVLTLKTHRRGCVGMSIQLTDKEEDSTFRGTCLYCAVSVKVTTGCPSANCPSAVTCTVPGVEGRVNTIAALPVESVVTIRPESEPAVVLKKIVPPAALPPDCPALSVTDRFSLLPAKPF